MAADSKIEIDLELRKEQAEARLRQFEQKAAQQLERLQAVQARYNTNPNAFTRNQLLASQGAYTRRIDAISGAASQVNKLQMKLDEESAKRGGRLFGMQVSKTTEKFVKGFVGAYVGREMMSIGFAAMYTPNGNNAGVRKAEGMTSGAVEGGAIGSVFGPWGIAIGVAVGALGGFTKALIQEKKEIERAQNDRYNSRVSQKIDSGRNIQNQAFQQVLDYSARPVKISKLSERIEQLQNGKGEFSIRNLEARLQEMENKGDHESAQYQKLTELHNRALAEKTQLQSQLFQEVNKPYFQMRDVSRFSDSKAKQGLYAGAGGEFRMIDSPQEKWRTHFLRQGMSEEDAEAAAKEKTKNSTYGQTQLNPIDFKTLNNPVVRELEKIRSYLERVAGDASHNGSDKNAAGSAANAGMTYRLGI